MKSIAEIVQGIQSREMRAIARALTIVERQDSETGRLLAALNELPAGTGPVLGITGAPGAGKSTLIDQLIARWRASGRRVGVLAIDPSSPRTSGALLGDRIRMMQHSHDAEVIIRSMASRGDLDGVCPAAGAALEVLAAAGCDPLVLETVGIGQAQTRVRHLVDLTVLVVAPGCGDEIQAMKAGVVETADILAISKADLPGADALASELAANWEERGARILCLSAHTGRGIPELIQVLDELSGAIRASPGMRQRQGQRFREEVIGQVLALLRPRLAARLEQHQFEGSTSTVAKRLLDELMPPDQQRVLTEADGEVAHATPK